MCALYEAEGDVRLRRGCLDVRAVFSNTAASLCETDVPGPLRSALRPNWVSPADEDLITAPPMRTPFSTTAPLNRPSYASSSQPYPSRPPPPSAYDPYNVPPNRGIVDLPRSQAVVHGLAGRANGKDEGEEANGTGTVKQWEVFLQASNLGESSSSWRLALPSMASSLTIHLIDGASRAPFLASLQS